ncbi:MAG TPA: ARMT1-like domain-containing protein [bacterium]|nr:ARMT1-like domain-containing protein [bacterium]
MHTTLDCIPCIVRQALESARFVSKDPALQEQLLRHILALLAHMDMTLPPPYVGQIIHRELRRITGDVDPYLEAKAHFNHLAQGRLPFIRQLISKAPDPLLVAARIAIAGNIIDFGVDGALTEVKVDAALEEALTQPLEGQWEGLTRAFSEAKRILYIADNAGEILFDRLLIEQLHPMERVTLAVRGWPILNDATREDAAFAGLDRLVQVIDNGSDAPGTILAECSLEFVREFHRADLIIAKGQGNFETLSDVTAPIFFLFKAKCPVIAAHAGVGLGALVVLRSKVLGKMG